MGSPPAALRARGVWTALAGHTGEHPFLAIPSGLVFEASPQEGLFRLGGLPSQRCRSEPLPIFHPCSDLLPTSSLYASPGRTQQKNVHVFPQ